MNFVCFVTSKMVRLPFIIFDFCSLRLDSSRISLINAFVPSITRFSIIIILLIQLHDDVCINKYVSIYIISGSLVTLRHFHLVSFSILFNVIYANAIVKTFLFYFCSVFGSAISLKQQSLYRFSVKFIWIYSLFVFVLTRTDTSARAMRNKM